MAWTITVEVAFATQPLAPTPTWTDITPYVIGREGITRTWGRTDEFSDVQPSTLTLTLNNTDGRFTRGLSSSPYYPNVRNGRRIRVSATRGGTMQAALGINPDASSAQISSDLNHLQAVGVQTLWLVLAVEWAFPSNSTGDSAILAKYDDCINGAVSRGMKVAIQAHGCPTWINAAGTWHGPNTATERSNWVACLHTFINRYGASKITWVEIWNEPNLTSFWTQGVSPNEYARLLQASYVDVKASWPTVKVVGHNISRNDIGWYNAVYTELDTVFGASTAAANSYYFDCAGVHPYCGNSTSGYDPADTSHADEPGTGGGALDPDFTGYRRIRDAVFAKEAKYKPVCIGEFGYATLGSGWFKVTESQRAAYVPSAMALARADSYVDYLNVFYHRIETPTDYATSFNIHGSTTETAFTTTAAAGAVYRRFDGHVNEWPTEWEAGGGVYAEATITATDRFKRFSQDGVDRSGEMRSMLEEEYLRDQAGIVGAYFPLSEDSDAITVGNIGPTVQNPGVIVQIGSGGELAFGSGAGPGTDGLSAPLFTPASATAGKYLRADLTTPIGGGSNAVTIEAWFRTEGAITARAIALLETFLGGRYELVIDAGGLLQATSHNGADDTNPLILTSAGQVNDGRTHHAAYTVSLSGGTVTGRLYLDGVEVDNGTYSSGGLGSCPILRIGGRKNANLFAGTIAHVACASAVLSAARIFDHANAGLNGLAGERTDQRIGRFADYMDIPAGDRAFDVGDSTVGAQSTSGKGTIEAMREVEQAEAGVLYIAGDGRLTFHKRSRRYNNTPAVTLTGAQLLTDLAFPGDDFGMVNDFSVGRPGGAIQRVVDTASRNEYGLYRDSMEIPASSDTATLAAAQWRVGNYGMPRTRVPSVTVELARLEQIAPSQVALLLAADISSMIRLTSLPAQAPASSIDLFVEGGTETFTGWLWRLQFNTSPAGFSSPVWQLDVTGFSELDISTRLGA
jgi:hypothetical protein